MTIHGLRVDFTYPCLSCNTPVKFLIVENIRRNKVLVECPVCKARQILELDERR
jgi:DNA-directed RNA polymerase subunit RPC12/RpoP